MTGECERGGVRVLMGKRMIDIADAVTYFSTLAPKDKASFLAALAHELTIVARDTCEAGTENLTHPSRMRAVNEVQHRLTAFLAALLRGDPQRHPHDILVRILLEHPRDAVLERQLAGAFNRTRSQIRAAA
jgi:hypothetical protein